MSFLTDRPRLEFGRGPMVLRLCVASTRTHSHRYHRVALRGLQRGQGTASLSIFIRDLGRLHLPRTGMSASKRRHSVSDWLPAQRWRSRERVGWPHFAYAIAKDMIALVTQ
jgi:hypothetical protein